MYTLRRITENNCRNQSLGDTYAVVKRDYNKESFRHYFKSLFGRDHVADLDETSDENIQKVIAFVVTHEIIPIYNDSSYWVMTDTGATFECLNRVS